MESYKFSFWRVSLWSTERTLSSTEFITYNLLIKPKLIHSRMLIDSSADFLHSVGKDVLLYLKILPTICLFR